MSAQPNLLLIGASVRAAACSALRAGFRPWCADLFGDADLRCRCPTIVLDSADYPKGFRPLLEQAPRAPWLYTGGLENHPTLVGQLARLLPLWGNGPDVLRRARSPRAVAAVFREQGIPHPEVALGDDPLPSAGLWLCKPLRSAGGAGIHLWSPGSPVPAEQERTYWQRFLEGPSCAAVYVGNRGQARLLGVTRQLVGESWLHAGSFRYCGSIGPLALPDSSRATLQKIGAILASHFGLQGLFGVDCVVVDGIPYPVEINPRYPASLEVLELAAGLSTLELHQAAFTAAASQPGFGKRAGRMVGKAILFAPTALTFPGNGPWYDCSGPSPADFWTLPPLADVPGAGTRIEAGHPILTVFGAGDSEEDCRVALKRQVERVKGWW